MELALTALAGMAGGTGVAAGASAGLTILQGIGTAVSVLGSIGAGNAAAAQNTALASEAWLEAGQERNAQVQRTIQMKRELMKVLGENDVAFAAAGIEIAGGIAESSATAAKKRAAQEINVDRQQSKVQRGVLKIRAKNYRKAAQAEQGGALLGALGTVADFGIDLVERA